jgi:hypothetical protein
MSGVERRFCLFSGTGAGESETERKAGYGQRERNEQLNRLDRIREFVDSAWQAWVNRIRRSPPSTVKLPPI